jgi:hypothetical protein
MVVLVGAHFAYWQRCRRNPAQTTLGTKLALLKGLSVAVYLAVPVKAVVCWLLMRLNRL